MTRPVYVLNGTNLNMLGRREPHLYGGTTLGQIKDRVEALAGELGIDLEFRQTNHEGVMIDWIQEAFENDAAVIINPAGFSFDCIPILDALKLIRPPLVEVHITNIHARGEQYQHSLVSLVATGVIAGLGASGYLLALRHIAEVFEQTAAA
jgi:3-dehydroquinate dehydratase II